MCPAFVPCPVKIKLLRDLLGLAISFEWDFMLQSINFSWTPFAQVLRLVQLVGVGLVRV